MTKLFLVYGGAGSLYWPRTEKIANWDANRVCWFAELLANGPALPFERLKLLRAMA